MKDPRIVSGPKLAIAPPNTSLASVDSPDAEPMRLLLTVELTSRQRAPAVDSTAGGERKRTGTAGTWRTEGHSTGRRDNVAGNDTVLDGHSGAAAEIGVGRDLNAATSGDHALLPHLRKQIQNSTGVTPPVMVTPSIDTVGSVNAPKVPIVRTGPPPLITV